jgi:hypothetical protein
MRRRITFSFSENRPIPADVRRNKKKIAKKRGGRWEAGRRWVGGANRLKRFQEELENGVEGGGGGGRPLDVIDALGDAASGFQ